MATKEIKPGQTIQFLNQAAAAVSDAFGIKCGPSGSWPDQVEAQVIPEAGNAGFSVTIEHTLDPLTTRGWNVIATITTQVATIVSVLGGYIRITIGTATGGNVSVLLTIG